MKFLGQLGIILAFAYAGHLFAAGLGVPFPASVIGILLLLGGLRTGWIKEERVDAAAQFLLANMAFFFVPSSVEIIGSAALVRPVLPKFLAVILISTVVAFFVTYAVVRGLRKLLPPSGKNS
jgi:holin-like protein